MRGTELVDVIGGGRSDTDHSPLAAARAKERPDSRAEFAERPAGVDVFEHGYHVHPFQIARRGQQPGLQQSAVHISNRVPAWFLGRLQRIERVSAGHRLTVASGL